MRKILSEYVLNIIGVLVELDVIIVFIIVLFIVVCFLKDRYVYVNLDF